MSTICPTGLTIVCDSREHKFLSFPKVMRMYQPSGAVSLLRVRTTVQTLETGDYSVDGHIHTLAVERKGSPRELYTNLFSWDYGRFGRAFDRLSKLEHKLLLLDMPLDDGSGDILIDGKKKPAGRIIDTLFGECVRRDVPVLWMPPGRDPLRAGTLLIRWFMAVLRKDDV